MDAEKVDLKKKFAHLYNPSKATFSLVDVPELNFLMVDGHGNPNTSPEYVQAIEALYSMAYGIKFALKPQGIDFTVLPLEGLWWVDDMSEFSEANKDRWDWTAMIMQPEWVNMEIVERIRAEAGKKKDLPALSKLRFAPYHEGLSVQILYFGPWSDEGPTIARMHAWIQGNGYLPNGKHHEIYLGDPRRTAPEKLKTIIRQPVRQRDVG